MGEIHCHIVADDRLNLAKPPLGLIRMCYEIAKAEIEHELCPCCQVMVIDPGLARKRGTGKVRLRKMRYKNEGAIKKGGLTPLFTICS